MDKNFTSFMEIHDYEITSYRVDFSSHELQMFAEYYNEQVIVIFNDLLAHHFENVTDYNIFFDITQVSIEHFIKKYEKFLIDSLKSWFPTKAKDPKELKFYLIEDGYKVFEIYSSIGLNGFVIAKELSIKKL